MRRNEELEEEMDILERSKPFLSKYWEQHPRRPKPQDWTLLRHASLYQSMVGICAMIQRGLKYKTAFCSFGRLSPREELFEVIHDDHDDPALWASHRPIPTANIGLIGTWLHDCPRNMALFLLLICRVPVYIVQGLPSLPKGTRTYPTTLDLSGVKRDYLPTNNAFVAFTTWDRLLYRPLYDHPPKVLNRLLQRLGNPEDQIADVKASLSRVRDNLGRKEHKAAGTHPLPPIKIFLYEDRAAWIEPPAVAPTLQGRKWRSWKEDGVGPLGTRIVEISKQAFNLLEGPVYFDRKLGYQISVEETLPILAGVVHEDIFGIPTPTDWVFL